MESTRCIKCNTETYHRDCICVSCKSGITNMYEELIDLLEQDKRYKLLKKLRGKKGDKRFSIRANNQSPGTKKLINSSGKKK